MRGDGATGRRGETGRLGFFSPGLPSPRPSFAPSLFRPVAV